MSASRLWPGAEAVALAPLLDVWPLVDGVGVEALVVDEAPGPEDSSAFRTLCNSVSNALSVELVPLAEALPSAAVLPLVDEAEVLSSVSSASRVEAREVVEPEPPGGGPGGGPPAPCTPSGPPPALAPSVPPKLPSWLSRAAKALVACDELVASIDELLDVEGVDPADVSAPSVPSAAVDVVAADAWEILWWW